MMLQRLQRIALTTIILLTTLSLNADFFCKVPELNPVDSPSGYAVFLPPWYPSDVGEAEKYTVNAVGVLVKRPEDDQGLLEYGKPLTKGTAGVPEITDPVVRVVRRLHEDVVFDRVLSSPTTVVKDFYTHVGGLLGGQTVKSNRKMVLFGEAMGSGYPTVSMHRMVLYDSWAVALQSGWAYKTFSTDPKKIYPSNWKGVLVPNFREVALWFASEGEGTARACMALLERNRRQYSFVPELEVLRALSGQDHGFTIVNWKQEYLNKLFNDKAVPWPLKTADWDSAMRSVLMRDLTSRRAPDPDAFVRIRDMPELAEPFFLKLVDEKKTDVLMKRNLAMLFERFTSPRAAQALHKLAADQDPVTAVRAANSLSRHPHGDTSALAVKWCDPKVDAIRRAKGILLMGDSRDIEHAKKLVAFYPKATDEFEQELVLRALLRLRYKPALNLFQTAARSRFESLKWTGRMGIIILNDGEQKYEKKALSLIREAFFKIEAKPGSGKIVSFSQFHRFDLVTWMAHSKWKKIRLKLWEFITKFKDYGPTLEVNGTANLLAHGFYEINLIDKVIGKGKAIPVLEKMTMNPKTDILLRIAAMARLTSLNRDKGLKMAIGIVDPVLQGRVGALSVPADAIRATHEDLVVAAIQIVQMLKPDDASISRKILMSATLSGRVKEKTLKEMYRQDREATLKIVKASLKYYGKKDNLNESDREYLIKIIRLSGVYKDKAVLETLIRWVERAPDPWLRFMSLYSIRLALGSTDYVDVFVEDEKYRLKQTAVLRKKIEALQTE